MRAAGRLLLGVALLVAGGAHLVSTEEFYGQVPPWFSELWTPLDQVIVLASGVVEIVLGVALLVGRHQVVVGWVVAVFFVAVFPGNVSQYVTGSDAFGLETDRSRLVRLFFQPLLVVWALWCTGAWRAWSGSRRARHQRARG